MDEIDDEIDNVSVKVGEHEYQFVFPDRLYFFMRGEFDELHAEPYLRFVFEQFERVKRPLYSAYDLHDFANATPRGRQAVIQVKRPYPFAALAIVGAKFSMRALASMILTGGKLVAPSFFQFPIMFVETMTQANDWFDSVRKGQSAINLGKSG